MKQRVLKFAKGLKNWSFPLRHLILIKNVCNERLSIQLNSEREVEAVEGLLCVKVEGRVT